MRYTDRVYGEVEIKEPVILELINSNALKRLKGIDQYGYRPIWVKTDMDSKYSCTRFDHSMGVYLLLQRYGASLEEQIAGLVHDVSHTCFSHCFDYAHFSENSEKAQVSQDENLHSFIRETEIPNILKSYCFSLDSILDDGNFPLKENHVPNLCADRIDYILRDAIVVEEIKRKEADYFLENLSVKEGNWIFKNQESAQRFAKLFLRMNNTYYCGFISARMLRCVGECLRYVCQKNYISKNDLYATDKVVLEKIKKYVDSDSDLKMLWERMNGKIKADNNPKDYDIITYCKSRIVDPLLKEGHKVKRLSEVYKEWGGVVRAELKPKQYFLKFER